VKLIYQARWLRRQSISSGRKEQVRLKILKIEIARDFVKKRELGTGNRELILDFNTSTCL
jgi:hypothetical protein